MNVLHFVQCEACGRRAQARHFADENAYTWHAPKDWITVEWYVEAEDDQREEVYCSWACVRKECDQEIAGDLSRLPSAVSEVLS